ncbi:MAG: RluA family pseudouridine synthase [Bacteroidota bacterium]
MSKKRNQKWKYQVVGLPKKLPINIVASQAFPILGSKSAANKAIQSQRLFLNGRPAQMNDLIQNGDQLTLKGSGIKKLKKINFNLEIVFEDDHLIAINKPSGIAVNGNRNKTVENALADKNYNNTLADALPHPLAVHRIDVPTIGIVLLAKTKTALIALGRAFQNSQIKKEYVAVVHGKVPREGRINFPIKNKKAITDYKMLEVVPSRIFEHLSLVQLFPITGRTHQLRIHLQQVGHLIVGDKMYAEKKKTILGKGLMLCAHRMTFKHPITKKTITLQIKMPKKFRHILDRERKLSRK